MATETIDKMEPRFELRPNADGKKDLLLGQILLRGLDVDGLSGISAAVAELLGEPLIWGSGYETVCDNPKVRFMACVYDGEVAVLVQYGRYQQAFTRGEMNDLAALLKNELLNRSGEFGVTCEGIGDGRYCATIRHGAAVVLNGLSHDDLGNFIDLLRRVRRLSNDYYNGESLNTSAGIVTCFRSEDDGYTDAIYSIVANGRMVELTHEQFGAVIQALEQAYKAAVPFARISESLLTMGYGFVHLDQPLYKLELGEFAAEPLDYHYLAVLYQNAKRVLESPVPTTKVFDTTAGRTSISSFHLNKDSANLNYSFACDSDVQALSKAQLGELVSGLGTLAWEPNAAELEAKQSEPAADSVTVLNGWLGASYLDPSSLRWFNDQPLTVTLDPLALTINNIVAQLARLSAVAGIAWENQPQPLVKGGE